MVSKFVSMALAFALVATVSFAAGESDSAGVLEPPNADAMIGSHPVGYAVLLILLTIMSIVGQGLVQTIVVLGVTGGIGGSRVVRSAVIAIKENVYFQAAEAIGSSRWRTLVWHVVPNIVAPVIIVFSINIGAVIISEASLSFLGFGAGPARPAPEGRRRPPRPRAGEQGIGGCRIATASCFPLNSAM